MAHLSSGNLGLAAEPRSLPTLGEAPDLLVHITMTSDQTDVLYETTLKDRLIHKSAS